MIITVQYLYAIPIYEARAVSHATMCGLSSFSLSLCYYIRNVELKSTTVIGTDPTKNVKATFDGTGKPLNFKVSDKLAKEVCLVVSCLDLLVGMKLLIS